MTKPTYNAPKRVSDPGEKTSPPLVADAVGTDGVEEVGSVWWLEVTLCMVLLRLAGREGGFLAEGLLETNVRVKDGLPMLADVDASTLVYGTVVVDPYDSLESVVV